MFFIKIIFRLGVGKASPVLASPALKKAAVCDLALHRGPEGSVQATERLWRELSLWVCCLANGLSLFFYFLKIYLFLFFVFNCFACMYACVSSV